MPMDAFTSSAELYEVLSDTDGRLEREGPLLGECLHKAPGTRVLDLACGTGLHALFFAELGADVTALDVSADMIAHAKRHRPHARIQYDVGDMRELHGGPWDLALCLGNSLSLMPSVAEVSRVVERVAEALSPHGVFLVQILNYAARPAQRPRHRVERKPVGDRDIVAVKSLVPYERRTLLTLTFFALRDEEWESVSETAVLTHFGLDNVAASAERAGLLVEGAYGAFDKRPFAPANSPDLVCILRKP